MTCIVYIYEQLKIRARRSTVGHENYDTRDQIIMQTG